MGLTQSAIKTLHQPPLGIINNIGKIFACQTLGDSHCIAWPHWFCRLRLCLDFWQTCNLHPRQIIHYDIQRWNIHAAACHGKSRFLNIQRCARCRPNFTDLCLRVTESPDEIFTALPRVPQMPKLCPRFYDRGLNLDKSFTSFGTSCKRWNCKTLRRVKSHQKFSKVSGTAVSLFDSSSRSRFLSDFMIFVNICEIFVNRKAILEIKPGRSVRAG